MAYDKVTPLPADGVAWPCGLVAKSFFTDTYKLFDSNNVQKTINETGIAWESDKEYKFKNWGGNGDPNAWKKVQWIDVTDGKTFSINCNLQSISLSG